MNTLEDITFAAVWVFLPLLPVTHGVGLVAHCPRSAKLRHILLYPFRGGSNHTIFQAIAWVRARACPRAGLGHLLRSPGLVSLSGLSEVRCACAACPI